MTNSLAGTTVRILKFIIGAVLLVLALYAVQLNEIWGVIRGSLNLALVACVLFWIAGIVFLNMRWQSVLSQMKCVSFRTTLKIYVWSLLTNMLLPFRAGDAFRVIGANKSFNVEPPLVVATLIIERTINAIILVILGCTLTFLVPDLKSYRPISSLMLGVIFFGVFLLFYRRDAIKRYSCSSDSKALERKTFTSKLKKFLQTVVQGLLIIEKPTILFRTVITSLAYLSMVWFGQTLLIRNIQPENAMMIAIVVILFVNIAALLPLTPANFGPYQWACILAFSIFGLEKSTAVGFSLVLQSIRISAVLILALCLWGLKFVFGTKYTST